MALMMILACMQVAGARPFDRADAAILVAICSGEGLTCAETFLQTQAAGVQRDHSIKTINDLQKDFFLESALVVGGKMTLHDNLRDADAAPRKAFLTASSASQMPALTSDNAAALVKHFGISPNSEMAKATATAAYLCGYGALPGEKMACAASGPALKEFVAAELGSKVKVLSTSNTPSAAAPAVKKPVTVAAFRKGSVAEGQKIVVCHVVSFPTLLFYCHRVTGTKEITATLQSDEAAIEAVGVCHIDTSLWLSTHPAFAALHIPRGDEACHWLVDSDLVFVPSAAAAGEDDAEMK